MLGTSCGVGQLTVLLRLLCFVGPCGAVTEALAAGCEADRKVLMLESGFADAEDGQAAWSIFQILSMV